MLNGLRVLDLTGLEGMFCGYVLAHLGCDVLAVEPPGGSPARQLAPRDGDRDGESLWWAAYGRGKRSTVLDLETATGRDELKALVVEADFVLHSLTMSEQTRVGLDYHTLAAINPEVLVVAITPFGAFGPKADWPATDLTVWAASGAHALSGDDDRAPVRTSVPQSFLHAGAEAAGAALIAYHERTASGRGQFVDVSAQQACAQAALGANLAVPNDAGFEVMRVAGGLKALFPIRLTWPCRDGYIALTLLFGPAFTEPNRRFLEWVHEHGLVSDEEVATDWGAELAQMTGVGKDPTPYFELCEKIEQFTKPRTQQELFEEGLARGCYIAPTFDIAGLLDEKHFIERDFWHKQGGVRVPGAFSKLSRTPLQLPGPAPALGEGGERGWVRRVEITENGRGARDPNWQDPRLAGEPDLPLKGLKVLDFMWVIAGPFFTRVLSDYGATVIKVESSTRLEPARGAAPFKNGEPGVENGVPFANFNAGKMGVTIDPSNETGREVIRDLVRWADVVSESFSPKAMKGWGLDYESLKEVDPSIVMISSCLMGQTGPRALVPGYGNMAAALTGFYDLTGWHDRSPAGPYLAYTDGVAPRFMLASVLAALEHRRRTGEGQYIDISQAEAAIHLLAPAILEHERNGRVWHRDGNRDLELAPHGVYAAAGEEAWIAIACQDDGAWPALCEVIGAADLAGDAELATATGRRASHDEIDARIQAWAGAQSLDNAQAALIAAGVAAHAVQNSGAAITDPQFIHQEHFRTVPHSLLGEIVVEGQRAKLSRTPGRVLSGAPTTGEHNFMVLKEILGYDDDRIADIYASLAME